MATHSSVLAWRIPGTGKPAGLPSMGSHRAGHNSSDLAAAAAEDEMVGCHHRLNRHEFEQTLEDSEKIGKPGVLQSMGLQRVR